MENTPPAASRCPVVIVTATGPRNIADAVAVFTTSRKTPNDPVANSSVLAVVTATWAAVKAVEVVVVTATEPATLETATDPVIVDVTEPVTDTVFDTRLLTFVGIYAWVPGTWPWRRGTR